MDQVERQMAADRAGLIFANLVDFDTQYGHRNDVARLRAPTSSGSTRGWPRCCRRCAPTICWSSRPITATIRRRRAPIIRASTCRCSSPAPRVRAGVDLGTRTTFADLGQTLAEIFGVERLAHGTSFLREITRLRAVRPCRRFANSSKQREREILAPQAAKSADSRGRLRAEAEDDVRPAFQRDRDRIIHCKAFRRLKHKTQVFFAPTGDHYRTRLTHTLEVSQIARTIAKVLRLHEELTEAIALGHDLGHTPFGHAGERVIDALMPGGFNHYEQSLRIVDVLENDGRGLNLTWEVRDGIAQALEREVGRAGRHAAEHRARAPSKARSCASPISIAYVNHDIDDATRAGPAAAGGPAAPIRSTILGASSSARIATLVKDVVTETLAGGLTEIRMSERVLQRHARAAELPVRRGLRERHRHRRVPEGDRHPERAVGEGARAPGRVPRSPDDRGRRPRRRHARLSSPA